MPAIQTDTFRPHAVVQTPQGEYVHILAHAEGQDPSDPAVLRFNWYPYVSDATFNKDAARQFFGETCGFSEKSRNYIIDQIDFEAPK